MPLEYIAPKAKGTNPNFVQIHDHNLRNKL
jgi:hypothetical protein